MPIIPVTSVVNLSNLKARQAELQRREKQQKAEQQRRAEEERKKSADLSSTSRASTTKASTAKEPINSTHQMLIEELTDEFGQKIVSQIKWRAMTPPRDQCIHLKEQEQKEKQKKKQTPQNDMWTSEFGGGKRKTRKTRKTKKNKKSSSCKNKKYFFW